MNKTSKITEIICLIKKEIPIQQLMNNYSAEDVSTAYWILENEQVIEIEEDFEILNKK
jgi:hypothetical protein